jgi:hypothetical protein
MILHSSLHLAILFGIALIHAKPKSTEEISDGKRGGPAGN